MSDLKNWTPGRFPNARCCKAAIAGSSRSMKAKRELFYARRTRLQ
jgi:hypothetical protein